MDKAFNKIIKSQVKLTILSVVAVILITMGTTYALFSTTHRNTENQIISIGEINASITGGTPITLMDLYPIEESEVASNIPVYTFTLTNPNSQNGYAVNYELFLEDVTSTIMSTAPYNTYTQITSDFYDYIMFKLDNNPSASLGSIYDSTTGEFNLKNGYIDLGDSENHTLKFWISSTAPNNLQGKVLSLRVGMTAIATEEYDGANPPKLVANLIPVTYNETSGKWVMADDEFGEWYDYRAQRWANAVTVKQAKRGTYSVGDTIEMDDILGMWVWIPRFEYKYTNLGTNYAGGTQSLPGEINIKFVNGTSASETTDYIIHPAFRNGSSGYTNNAGTFSAYQLGGWDEELTGFWYGKFETSSLASANGTSTATLSDPIVKPNVIARRYQKVSDQYNTNKNVSTYHGITLDSHMSKNSEWGAVSYLSQSKYGKYGNQNYTGANKEIYINNSSSYYTGRSMGLPAGASGSTSSENGTYEYNNTRFSKIIKTKTAPGTSVSPTITNDENFPWTINNGQYESALTCDDEAETYLTFEFTLPSAGDVTFDWSVSSEEDCDILYYSIYDSNGDTLPGAGGDYYISGEYDYESVLYDLDAGTYTVEFVFYNDDDYCEGDNTAYIRNFVASYGATYSERTVPTQENGIGASTTGNIYGIYDMVGGSYEYQMGWLNTANTTIWGATSSSNYAGFSSAPTSHKYYEEFTTTIATTACGGKICYGQALSETGGWYNDYESMFSTSYPWIVRGANWGNYSSPGEGIFNRHSNSGNGDYNYGSRAVLT